jgi:uncharacterized membrane protein YebE (DUF533 family)
MNAYEHHQTVEANKGPTPAAKPQPADPHEAAHSEREGEYEYYMVRAALKAAARDKGVK